QSRSMNRAKALSVQRIRQLYQQYVTTVILIGLSSSLANIGFQVRFLFFWIYRKYKKKAPLLLV
ncbi:MAG: hypothetical protein WBL44_07385, partial [Nitrososphaeraceae archaeon]